MKIFNDSIYFTISTAQDLRENYDITELCITKVIEFLEAITDTELMFIYNDDKGHKSKKITEKSKQELFTKLGFGNIFSFGIMEYMKKQDYFWNSDAKIMFPNLSCSIELGNPNKLRSITNTFDGLDISIPTELLGDNKHLEKFYELFKELHLLMKGVNSFISRGTYNPTLCIMNGAQLIRTYYTMNEKWDEYVCGYFWGNVLTQKHLEKIGGFESIKEQGFYKVEKWNDDVYIQLSENILDYTILDATKIRKFLLPIFPPKEDKKYSIYSTADDLTKAQQSGVENFMLEEDLL